MALGPRPEGDAAGMRALAGQITLAAGPLGGLRAVTFENWQSGRAQEARGQISAHISAVSGAAGDLKSAASLLTSEAGELQREQNAWDRAKAAEERAEEARDRADRDGQGGRGGRVSPVLSWPPSGPLMGGR